MILSFKPTLSTFILYEDKTSNFYSSYQSIQSVDGSRHSLTNLRTPRTTDSLATTISSIRNAYFQSFEVVNVPKSKQIMSLLDGFVDAGYISSWANSPASKNSLCVWLKYYQNRPAIKGIQQISKPGKRAYFSKQRLLKTSEVNN